MAITIRGSKPDKNKFKNNKILISTNKMTLKSKQNGRGKRVLSYPLGVDLDQDLIAEDNE